MNAGFDSIREKYFTTSFLRKLIVFCIILLSFLLAIANSAKFESVDEKMIANWIWEFHEDPFRVNQYPPFFIYLHLLLTLCYRGFFLLTGMVQSGYEFLHTGVGYSFMIEAGRYVSAFFGMVMLYSIYKTGERFYGFSAAAASLLLIAFNDIFILHSHIFKSDIMVSALVTLSIYHLFRFLDEPRGKWMFLAALFFGFSFAAKYNIAVFLIIILMAALMERKNFPALKSIAAAAAGGVMGFLLVSPNWIVHPVGNLKKLFYAYNLEKGSVYIQDLSPSSIYISFMADIRDQFGTLLVFVLALGIVLSFIRKEKKGVLLSVFLIVYILFFGLTGFYGRRFLLPLLPVIALLSVRALFLDLPDLLKLKGRVKPAWTLIIIFVLAVCVFLNGTDVVKKFRILDLESKSDSAIRFRRAHNMNESRFVFGSHIMTPYIKGDVRLAKTLEIKPFFRKRGVPHFLQIREEAYRYYSGLPAQQGKYFIRLPEYRVFHRIERPKIQDWDYNLLFLYRIPQQLKSILPGNLEIKLPKMYGLNSGDQFYPGQIYEKFSGYFVSQSDLCATTLYSDRKITALRGVIYCSGSIPPMTVRVNHRKITLAPVRGRDSIARFHISGFTRKSPFYGNAYRVEIYPVEKRLLRKTVPFYVVMEPVPSVNPRQKTKFIPDLEMDGEIPSFPGRGKYPEWVKKVYRQTGVDLALYRLTQSVYFDFSPPRDRNSVHEVFLPLQPGDYLISADTRRYSESIPVGYDYWIEFDLISGAGKSSGRISGKEEEIYPFSVPDTGETTFVRFRFRDLHQSNRVLKGVRVTPIIKKYFKKITSWSNG